MAVMISFAIVRFKIINNMIEHEATVSIFHVRITIQ